MKTGQVLEAPTSNSNYGTCHAFEQNKMMKIKKNQNAGEKQQSKLYKRCNTIANHKTWANIHGISHKQYT